MHQEGWMYERVYQLTVAWPGDLHPDLLPGQKEAGDMPSRHLAQIFLCDISN